LGTSLDTRFGDEIFLLCALLPSNSGSSEKYEFIQIQIDFVIISHGRDDSAGQSLHDFFQIFLISFTLNKRSDRLKINKNEKKKKNKKCIITVRS